MQDAVLANRLRQLRQLRSVQHLAGLVGIRRETVYRDLNEVEFPFGERAGNE
jgi:DeoR/GlpR family transcriptional regulator of sugar metabolism